MKKKLFILIILVSSFSVAQNKVACWDTTISSANKWIVRSFPDFNNGSSFSYDVFDSTGSGTLLFALTAADTATPANGSMVGYHVIMAGASFHYDGVTTNKVYVKSASGNATFTIFKH